jgi:hypothetical protein
MSPKLKSIRIVFNGDYGAKSGFGSRIKLISRLSADYSIIIVCRNRIIIGKKHIPNPWVYFSRAMQLLRRLTNEQRFKNFEEFLFYRIAFLGSYDILHVGNIPPLFYKLLEKKYQCKTVILEGYTAPDVENRIKQKFKLNEAANTRSLKDIKQPIKILCPSGWSLNSYSALHREVTCIQVLYPMQDLEYHSEINKNPSNILVPVALKESKGLRIIDRLTDMYPGKKFYLCGRRYNNKIAARIIAKRNVKYCGYVDFKELPCKGNSLAIIPSLFEGSNNTVIELNKLGIPVIFLGSAGIATNEDLPTPLNYDANEIVDWFGQRINHNHFVKVDVAKSRQSELMYIESMSEVYRSI